MAIFILFFHISKNFYYFFLKYFLIFIIFGGLLLTFSRSGIIAFILTMVLFLASKTINLIIFKRVVPIMLFIKLFLVLFLIFISYYGLLLLFPVTFDYYSITVLDKVF